MLPSDYHRVYKPYRGPNRVRQKAGKRRRPDGSGPPRATWGKKTGVKGVYETPQGRFTGKFRYAGKLIYCGTYDTIEEAALAVETLRAEMGD